MSGTPIDIEKLRTLQVKGSKSKNRARPVEGRVHPDSGLPYISRTDENNATVTEHSRPGTGVSVRQDVEVRPHAAFLGG